MHASTSVCLLTSLSLLCEDKVTIRIQSPSPTVHGTMFTFPNMLCFLLTLSPSTASPHSTNLSISLFCCLLIHLPNSSHMFSSRTPLCSSQTAPGSWCSSYQSHSFSYCSSLSVYLLLLSLVLDCACLLREETESYSWYPQILVCKVRLHWVEGQQSWPANYIPCPLVHELYPAFWGNRRINFHLQTMVPTLQHLPLLGNVLGQGEPCIFVPLGSYSYLKKVFRWKVSPSRTRCSLHILNDVTPGSGEAVFPFPQSLGRTKLLHPSISETETCLQHTQSFVFQDLEQN